MYAVYRQNSFWNQPILRVNTETKNYATSHYNSKRKQNYETPKISVIGIDKIFNPNNHWTVRTIWVLVLVTMTSLCTLQLSKCLVNYFSFPVIKQTDVIRSDFVHFPAVQVCPGILRNLQYVYLIDNLEVCPDGKITCWVSDSFEKRLVEALPPLSSNTHAEDAWIFFGFQTVTLFSMCNDKDKDECETDGVKWSGKNATVITSSGPCMVFDTAEVVPFRGPFTFLKLRIHIPIFNFIIEDLKNEMAKSLNETERNLINQSLETTKVGSMISVQQTFGTNKQHLYMFESQDVYSGFETHLQLHQKQFVYKNRLNHYCDTQEEYFKCINKCIEANLSTICSPLYYEVDGKEKCPWTFEYIKLEMENFKVYNSLNLSYCKCPKICNEITYTMYPNVITKLENDSSMIVKIYFADNNVEKMTEKYSYNFTACLSDFGGHLGFFLGFCTLTIMEVFECALTYFFKHKNERDKVMSTLRPKKKRYFRDIFN